MIIIDTYYNWRFLKFGLHVKRLLQFILNKILSQFFANNKRSDKMLLNTQFFYRLISILPVLI